MSKQTRPWRGTSAEDRQQQRNLALREACLNVVGTQGVYGTTIDLVCAEAKLTKRYFYENFTGLDALLIAIVDDLTAKLGTRMEAAIPTAAPGSERSRVVTTILIDVLSEDPRSARLYVESPGHPLLRARRDHNVAVFTDFVIAKVLPKAKTASEARRRRLETRLLVAGTTDLVTSWLAGDVKASRKTLIDTIVRIREPA